VGGVEVEGRAAEAAHDSDARYRRFVEQIPAVTYTDVVEEGGPRLTYISPQIERLLGYPPERFMDDKDFWWSIVHPDDLARIEAAAEEQDAPFDEEYRVIAADGRVVWLHDECALVRDEDGTPMHWQGVIVDVTEYKQAEADVLAGRERTRLIVESALDAVITIDQDGRVTGWNPQAAVTFGWSSAEVLGRTLADIVIPEGMREAHRTGMERYLETGEERVLNHRIEVAALHRDGHEFPVELAITPIRSGGHVDFCAFVRDISERKRVEEDMERALAMEREAAQRLRELDDMKNLFLQAVSHELRTPLTAILGLSHTLERRDADVDEDEARRFAARISSNARRLRGIVENLLDLDRLARGITTPKLASVDLVALVARVLGESEVIEPARLHADLRPAVVWADGAKVERIVENLVANAARHTPESTDVWVSVRPVDGGAEIHVDDEGAGVPEELREAIFEPFQRGSESSATPGVGVGLAVVRRLAELHGGRAWVEPRVGGGASFRLFLPTKPAIEEPGSDDGAPSSAAALSISSPSSS
jgi:PAS domain S-box-containing protein